MKFGLFVLGAATCHTLVRATSTSRVITITQEFNEDIPERQLAVLSCPTGRGLVIQKAEWIATRPNVNAGADPNIKFERTKDISKICGGLNNCVLKPIAHLEKVEDGNFVFMGLPIENAEYKLNVKGICSKTPAAPIGREMISVIDSNDDLVLGCNEGEVINVSLLRGAGLHNSLIYRNLYCTNSFMENAFELCQNKRSCKISKDLYNSDNGKCIYQVIDAQYYCRPPHHHSYVDVVRHANGKFETILTSEENAHVIVKAPAESVLSVKSATWDVVGKPSEEEDPKRNRLDILQFYCEGRSSCSFIPTRASNGLLDLYLGGITGNIKKPFILRAKFEFVEPKNQEGEEDIKTVECKKGGNINIKCPNNTFPRVVTALWGGFVTNTKQQPEVIFWEEKTQNGKLFRVTEIGALLDKAIFNKHDYIFNPVEMVNGKQRLPYIVGVKPEDHGLVVNYTCMDKNLMPSVSDINIGEVVNKDSLNSAAYDLEKEKVLDAMFSKNDQLIIMIEQKSESIVRVGDFLKIQIPHAVGEHYTANFTDEPKIEAWALTETCDNVVLSIVFADEKTLHVTASFFNKNKHIETRQNEMISKYTIDYQKKVKNIVVASGGVVGMRVMVKGETKTNA
ncbi:uncharacterized protein BBOV_IV004810 [Babesia bovis T2Bo]|uniref:Membrane protein, putative n=1 Tax=Babesia bovis TaxID=5865 RepID=A7AQM3_BABBO|nr:uncharacterized protein BBOV_IV004810 [Babesia bovis T2Bo]EDO06842.1 hypothetical protein BBOV_IV004810 [Babesia bovis T2Bo]|eukprot:XP_001610410.1 hypothetical protein [Babesia bovis T2Bo]